MSEITKSSIKRLLKQDLEIQSKYILIKLLQSLADKSLMDITLWLIQMTDDNSQRFYMVGLCYQIRKNYEEALRWYKMAAIRNHKLARISIGDLYYSGLYGGQRNYREARNWYLSATTRNIDIDDYLKMYPNSNL